MPGSAYILRIWDGSILIPTNNCLVSDQHITIGWGRDYADIAPLDGIILSSGSHELTVSVDVKREH